MKRRDNLARYAAVWINSHAVALPVRDCSRTMKTIALSLVIGSAAGFPLAAPELPVPAWLLTVPSGSTEPLLTNVVAVAFADGTYTGPSIDAYYGLVQVQAV